MSASLYIEKQGTGTDLLLLHGWGLHGGVWDTLAPRLADRFRVTRMDLPGHGRSRDIAMPATLTELARMVMDAAPPHAVVLGWSLGGLVALRAALDAPNNMRALVLANATPRFVTGTDWPAAMPPETLAEFAAGLREDYQGILQRFLSLQVRGDEGARESLRNLRVALFAHGEPDAASLATGLELLRTSDLRAECASVKVQTLVLAGAYDRLTPAAAGEFLARSIHGARLHSFPKSAHAPFISHTEAFADALRGFMLQLNEGVAA